MEEQLHPAEERLLASGYSEGDRVHDSHGPAYIEKIVTKRGACRLRDAITHTTRPAGLRDLQLHDEAVHGSWPRPQVTPIRQTPIARQAQPGSVDFPR